MQITHVRAQPHGCDYIFKLINELVLGGRRQGFVHVELGYISHVLLIYQSRHSVL